jgi:hypothetical protein
MPDAKSTKKTAAGDHKRAWLIMKIPPLSISIFWYFSLLPGLGLAIKLGWIGFKQR